ncbi:MAG: hypothetical protein K9H16_04975 [Bacteroidales bacterium]|nr:hypothetical protein [Bacteroidales bacterium]
MKRFYTIFFITNLLLSFYFVDTWNNANTTSRAAPVVAFFETGNLQIDKYHELTLDKAFINGHYYTDKAPLPTLITIPFYAIIKNMGWVNAREDKQLGPEVYILGTFLCSAIPFTIILLLLFKEIYRNHPKFSSIFLAMMPLYGSFIFVYSGTFYAHMISSMFVLLGYLMLRRKAFFWAGILTGLAFLSEYTLALFFPVWALQIWVVEKNFFKGFQFGIGVLPSIIFIGIYNYIFTGTPFEMLYKYHTFEFLHENYGFVLPSLKSIWGLTFSNYKGMFFYTPVLILSLLYIFKSKSLKHFIRHYLSYISIIFFIFIASYDVWWGGWCYGPRLLFPLIVLLIFEGIIQLSKTDFSKPAFWALCIFGLLGAFLAKITVVYSIPSESLNPFLDTIVPNIAIKNFNPNNLFTIIFGIKPLLAASIWLFLFVTSLLLLKKHLNTFQLK